MTGYKYLIIITDRDYKEGYLSLLREEGVERVVEKFGEGTAGESTLDLFGLERRDKVVLEAIVPGEREGSILRGMKLRLNIEGIGNGIALFIPVDCIGGASSKRHFIGDVVSENKENSDMELSKNVLIITVVDKGNTDLVMDAAKSAGATGGSVIRAHGTGTEVAKFFGVSISEEKDMVHIVASRDNRDAIIRAIMEKAGVQTPAHGIVYCLPVDTVAGIASLE